MTIRFFDSRLSRLLHDPKLHLHQVSGVQSDGYGLHCWAAQMTLSVVVFAAKRTSG